MFGQSMRNNILKLRIWIKTEKSLVIVGLSINIKTKRFIFTHKAVKVNTHGVWPCGSHGFQLYAKHSTANYSNTRDFIISRTSLFMFYVHKVRTEISTIYDTTDKGKGAQISVTFITVYSTFTLNNATTAAQWKNAYSHHCQRQISVCYTLSPVRGHLFLSCYRKNVLW